MFSVCVHRLLFVEYIESSSCDCHVMPETFTDYVSNYMKKNSDLEQPLPLDSEIFLPERSVDARHFPREEERREVKMGTSLTDQDRER